MFQSQFKSIGVAALVIAIASWSAAIQAAPEDLLVTGSSIDQKIAETAHGGGGHGGGGHGGGGHGGGGHFGGGHGGGGRFRWRSRRRRSFRWRSRRRR